MDWLTQLLQLTVMSALVFGLIFWAARKKKNNKNSPPLSLSELADIQASEKEFATGKSQIFESVEEFLNDLHSK